MPTSTHKWIFAVLLVFSFVLVGVVVLIKNQKGEEIGRIEVPDGVMVEMQPGGRIAAKDEIAALQKSVQELERRVAILEKEQHPAEKQPPANR